MVVLGLTMLGIDRLIGRPINRPPIPCPLRNKNRPIPHAEKYRQYRIGRYLDDDVSAIGKPMAPHSIGNADT